MKTRTLLAVGLLMSSGLAVCNCGDSPGNALPDGGMPDDATFAGYVIDLVENKTADNTDPQPIPEDLADSEEPTLFEQLFN